MHFPCSMSGAEEVVASKRRPRGVVLQPSEEKDLRRVFETLAGCAKKDLKKKAIEAKQNKMAVLTAKMEQGDRESDEDSESEEEIGCQIDELQEEVESLEQELKQMDEEAKKKITAQDLDHTFRTLGLPKTKKYLEVSSLDVKRCSRHENVATGILCLHVIVVLSLLFFSFRDGII